MIIRKLLTFFLACILIPAIIALFSLSSSGEFIGWFWVFFMSGAPLLLLYGMPISFLSDKITKKLSPFIRLVVSFVVHLFFGIILVFIILFLVNERWDELSRLFLVCSTVGAFVVWGIDEVLRKVADWEKIQSGM